MKPVKLTAAYIMTAATGYVGYIEELPFLLGQGPTVEEARIQLLAAMELWLISNRRTVKTQFNNRSVVRRETIAHVTAAPIKPGRR